jgi:hypothetical protein
MCDAIPDRGLFGVWLRPVERTVRVREVPSSNLGTPTAKVDSLPEGVFFFIPVIPLTEGRQSRHPDKSPHGQPIKAGRVDLNISYTDVSRAGSVLVEI